MTAMSVLLLIFRGIGQDRTGPEFDTTTNLWLDAFMLGRGLCILTTMMTMVTTMEVGTRSDWTSEQNFTSLFLCQSKMYMYIFNICIPLLILSTLVPSAHSTFSDTTFSSNFYFGVIRQLTSTWA
jgi:hypothetical protein